MLGEDKERVTGLLREIAELSQEGRDRFAKAIQRQVSVVQLLRQGRRTYNVMSTAGVACDDVDYLLFGGVDTTGKDGALTLHLNNLLCARIGNRNPNVAAEVPREPPRPPGEEQWLVPTGDVGPVLLTSHDGPALLAVNTRVEAGPWPDSFIPVTGAAGDSPVLVSLDVVSYEPGGKPRDHVLFSWQCLVRVARWGVVGG